MDEDHDERTEAAAPPFMVAPLPPAVLYKREPLPWVLFITTLVLFMISTVILVNRSNANLRALNAAIDAQVKAETREKNAIEPLTEKIAELDAQVKTVTAQREALADRVKAFELKAAEPVKKPTAVAAPPPAKKKVAAPVKKKRK